MELGEQLVAASARRSSAFSGNTTMAAAGFIAVPKSVMRYF
jgi:hypothetical protein